MCVPVGLLAKLLFDGSGGVLVGLTGPMPCFRTSFLLLQLNYLPPSCLYTFDMFHVCLFLMLISCSSLFELTPGSAGWTRS